MLKIRQAVDKSRAERGFPTYAAGIGGLSVADAVPDSKLPENIKRLDLDSTILRKNRIFRGHEQEAGSISYKMLRTQVYQALKRNGWNSLGITSANPSEGKTTTAINLALALAHSVYERVILVDFDLRKPNVHATMGFKPEVGISDFLTNPNIEVQDTLYETGDDMIIVVPGRESLANASELLTSNRIKYFLHSLKSMFPSHFIIFDLPPILVVDDVIAFNDKDALLVVAAEGKTYKQDIITAVELFKTQQVLGYVLNMAEAGYSGKYKKYGYY